MDLEFPKMMYRFPASGINAHKLEDGNYDTATVTSTEDEAAAHAEGWRATWPEARQVDADAKAAAFAAANAVPTRDELEQKARELNITFDGRTSDKKLGDLIKATLET